MLKQFAIVVETNINAAGRDIIIIDKNALAWRRETIIIRGNGIDIRNNANENANKNIAIKASRTPNVFNNHNVNNRYSIINA